MKETIADHEIRLKWFRESIEEDQKKIKRLEERLEIQFYHYNFYKQQIEEAKRKGKDGFDSDRFMRSKKNG